MEFEFAAEAWLGGCQYCLVDEDQMLFYTPLNEEMSAVQYAPRRGAARRPGRKGRG
ncbi:MAG: hypothetical protein QMD46_01180 [Methanomicrobiales archaeon]|nr:hypothetical protein [Methanomicrobiales archaeon]MDI6875708.1 hypothetical protein [Methanomicrobiales archaeon]